MSAIVARSVARIIHVRKTHCSVAAIVAKCSIELYFAATTKTEYEE